MNSYISRNNPRDTRPNGYVTSPTPTLLPNGYVTHVRTPDFSGSYIDANTASRVKRTLQSVR